MPRFKQIAISNPGAGYSHTVYGLDTDGYVWWFDDRPNTFGWRWVTDEEYEEPQPEPVPEAEAEPDFYEQVRRELL
jgi:hypothetical protein